MSGLSILTISLSISMVRFPLENKHRAFYVYRHLHRSDCVFQFQEFLTRTASVKDTKILVIACKHPNY